MFWKEGEKKREKNEREKKRKKVREKKEKKIKKIGTNFFRGKLETKLLIYPAWLLFHLIIFTAVVIFTYILLSRAT